MSGVVGLGDLQALLEATDPVKVVHKLGSMKIGILEWFVSES